MKWIEELEQSLKSEDIFNSIHSNQEVVMVKNLLRFMILTFALSMLAACEQPEFSSEAERLAAMSGDEMMEEFVRLGNLPGAPGPIPVGDAEGISGLFMFSNIRWISQRQQDIAYALVWSGKVFHIDETVPCSSEKGGSFWLENKLETVFKALYLAEGDGNGILFHSNDAWNGDGNGIIQVDYADTTPALSFVHDEMRLANWDQETDLATYLGIMWVKIGSVKYAFAYFIPDGITPHPCEEVHPSLM